MLADFFMIKVILFDCDGPIIQRKKYFSQRLKEEKGIVVDAIGEQAFFQGELLLGETGKADLKEILPGGLRFGDGKARWMNF